MRCGRVMRLPTYLCILVKACLIASQLVHVGGGDCIGAAFGGAMHRV